MKLTHTFVILLLSSSIALAQPPEMPAWLSNRIVAHQFDPSLHDALELVCKAGKVTLQVDPELKNRDVALRCKFHGIELKYMLSWSLLLLGAQASVTESRVVVTATTTNAGTVNGWNWSQDTQGAWTNELIAHLSVPVNLTDAFTDVSPASAAESLLHRANVPCFLVSPESAAITNRISFAPGMLACDNALRLTGLTTEVRGGLVFVRK